MRDALDINGLKNTDFKIYEDTILQKMATFAEGTKPPVQVLEDGSTRPLVAGEPAEAPGNPGIDLHSDAFVGTNVFVLFDTSNFMYPALCTPATENGYHLRNVRPNP
jgi:hypothetical protein